MNTYKTPWYSSSYMPQTYTPPASQYTQRQADYQQQMQQPSISGFSWVDGINAAKAQNIGFGTSWIFFDVRDKIFYIKTVGLDGVPQPLFIAKYTQISENDLPQSQQGQTANVDMSEYVKKSDIDMSAYATKADIEKLIEALESKEDYVTNDDLEDKVMKVIQDKMSAPRTRKTAQKEEV